MKIETVLLENFGLFGGRRYRFDGQPLVLIYGANESGKTTTLNGLRQALFGFPHKSAYLTGKPMSAEVTVSLRDGRTVRFARQKKRSDSFTAMIDGKIPLDESQWFELAGGLDLKSYQSLFGFSLDELREGEKALAHAPLNEALSGSGLGGLARLQQVHNRLDTFLTATLKRAGTGGTINAKLAEIEAAEKQLESVLTLPADVAQLREQYAAAQQTVERVGDQVRELRASYESWQRRQTALPRAIEYRQVEASLQAHELPAAIDEAFRLQWTVTNNKLAGARTELANEERKLASLQTQLAALPEASAEDSQHAETRRLAAEAGQVAERSRQVAEDARECEELERELGEALRRLDCSLDDRQWRQIELDDAQRAELEGLRRQAEQLSGKLAACQTRLEMATAQLGQRAPTADDSAWPENLDQLDALIRQARLAEQNYQQHARQLSDFQAEQCAPADAQQLLAVTRRFEPAGGAIVAELDSQWPVPAAEQAAAHRQQLAQLSAQHERLSGDLDERIREMEAIRRELVEAKSTHGLMSLDELEGLWGKRDEIVRNWRAELRAPLVAAGISTGEQEARLTQLGQLHAQADAAVRTMLESLDRVAAMIAKQQRLADLEVQRSALAAQLADAQTALAQAQAAWCALWSGCPFVPQAPERMLAWLEQYRNWRTRRATLERMLSEQAALSVGREQALAALHQQWPAPAATSPSSTAASPAALSIADSEKIVGQWRAAAVARAAEQKLIGDVRAAHQAATREHEQTRAQWQECQLRYQQVLAALGLPVTWPLSEISARLESLGRCRTTAARIDKIRQRIASAQAQLDHFTAAVHAHAQARGESCAGPPERLAAGWLEELNRHETMSKQRADLSVAITGHAQTLERRSQQVLELEEVLKGQVSLVGAASQEQVQQWIRGASEVFQLRTRQKELAAALETCAGEQPLDAFLAELAALDEISVTTAAARLSAQLSGAELALQTAVKEFGGLTRELQYREQGSAALECEQRLKRLRSELVELSEQWAVHRLAAELLTRTINRFTEAHEPQLLKHTRRFFRELTDDRYCVVEHDSGKHGGFAVRDQQGHAWQPDKLSTGTREQLYLAIRLAFITHFNEQREPLPVIMDDCFVNFDDTRARIALRTLIHWQESVQTILLSCHWRSVEALAELAPETPVITIATGETTTAGQLVTQTDAFV